MLGIEEAAKKLGVKARQMRNLCRIHGVAPTKTERGPVYRVTAKQLEYIERHRRGPGRPATETRS